MKRLKEILERKFIKDIELLELEDYEEVIECKMTKPYNAHYNEYKVVVNENEKVTEHYIYLKHR